MRFAPLLRRLHAHGQAGSAILEFAFVAPIFFVFLMGTIETGIIFLGDFMLQNATADASRQIRTGQVALNGVTQAQFRQLICDGISALLSCDTKLQIDVETYADFSSATITDALLSDGTLDPSLTNWNPGTVCSIVLVRAFYTWDVATPLLTPFLVNMSSDKHLLSAAAAFRNEPYTTVVSGC